MFEDLATPAGGEPGEFTLQDGSRVAVIGGGPAGSFFSYFFLRMAERVGLSAGVDIYERKNFGHHGPRGCNHCGGIVSESLVQILATEGINLPTDVVQRGIESYVLHMDVGTVKIQTPTQEKRIAAMYRGAGPRGTQKTSWRSFDTYLQGLAVDTGAEVRNELVKQVRIEEGRPVVTTKAGESRTYDLVVGALGVNSPSLKVFEEMGFGFEPPDTTKTFITEYHLGYEAVRRQFQDAMHVFLLDLPRLKFAALIPKGNFVTMCLLGEKIDKELVKEFVQRPEVAACFPPGTDLIRSGSCKCFPKINIKSAVQPFTDRVVLIGDSAATRLYKDGIGAAYITAKAAAACAVLQGVSSLDFGEHYWPACKTIVSDNAIGKLVFLSTRLIQGWAFSKRGILRMVSKEQTRRDGRQPMSTVLWDTFTGSATYRDILRRSMKPSFLADLAWETTAGLLFHRRKRRKGA